MLDRRELLEMLAAAEKALEAVEIVHLTENGLEPVPPRPPARALPMRIHKVRKNSKQGRRERGGIV
jgi:hypothetical protein